MLPKMILWQLVNSCAKHVLGAEVFLANEGGFESPCALSFFPLGKRNRSKPEQLSSCL